MEKVIVASKNPTKIQAAKRGFEKVFPGREFEFIGVSVPSGVAEQPIGDDETFIGAKNRADNASEEIKDCDFYVGMEGGVNQVKGDMGLAAWVVIKSSGKYGKARTGTLFLPKKIVELINEGKNLGEADDIIFQRSNSKRESGAVGILTENVISRTDYFMEAVILALIPFKNVDLY